MLSIRAARSAQYYEAREFVREDYYAEAGQAPAQWLGRGAEVLGLAGVPEPGELQALLEGRHPESGEPLRAGAARTRNAGFDLTFAAPKSVSVLLAVGDTRVRDAVLAAHQEGVEAALDYLERHELQARRGHAGARIVGAEGFIGARYTHEMSRSGDPHLHTHVVVANLVRGPDGRFTAPDMRPIYAANKTAGMIAEAVSRQALTQRLGVEWGPVQRSGAAEVAGIPDEILRHFSARHQEIAELVAFRGVTSVPALAAAQRQTRDHKPRIDRETAQRDWRARAAEQGFGRPELARVLDRAVGDPALLPRPLAELDARLSGPRGLTERASTFTRREVLRAYAEAHPAGATLPRLEELADGFLARRAVLLEPELPERGIRATYTTPDLLRVEQRLLSLAGERGVWRPLGPANVAAALAEHPHLGADQRAAVRYLAGGDGRVRALEAHAGRGKTAALAALVDAHRGVGAPVLGTAWQGEAAQTLARQAGLPAETTARLLRRLERDPEALPSDAVLIVDEAATMPTRALCALTEAVAAGHGRLILVGDRAQLPSIDAGGAFAALADRLGAATLSENRRQQDPLQRAVADTLAEGRPHHALALLETHGGLRSFASPEDARAQLIGDWARAALSSPGSALILAHDRTDVRALNHAARAELDAAGLLGPERLVACGREWAAGDRLVCRRNDYRLEVRNGTRGTVAAVDPERGALTMRADDGRAILLPADYLEDAQYGYALTGHVSQGATVERTYLLASPERGGAEWAYVAGSRHRLDLRVYAVADEPERAAEALAESWERRQAKHLASERLEAAGAVARGREPDTPVRPAERAPAEADPLASARVEHAALVGALRAGAPPDPGAELRGLEAQAERLHIELGLSGVERARAESERAAIGRLRLLTLAGRDRAEHLEERAWAAGVRQRALTAELRQVTAQEARARADVQAREEFASALPVRCRRLEALEAALAPGCHPSRAAKGPRPSGPAPALWAEREVLREHLAGGGPPEPSARLRALEQDLARVEDQLRANHGWQGRLSEGAQAIGPLRLVRHEGRNELRRIQGELARAREQAQALGERRRALLGPLAAARAEQAERERWAREDAPVLARRLGALERELARQAEAAARAAECERPPYLERALGCRPEHERPLARWREALRELEGQRLRHGIADPERPLGPEPVDPAQAEGHRLAEWRLAEARQAVERAQPGYHSPFTPRSAPTRLERSEDPAPRGEPRLESRQEPRQGPSLGLGL